MRRRLTRLLAIGGGVAVVLVASGWVFLAKHSRWFIERPIVETPLHVGDVHRLAGPWMHFPDGDMYLLYWNLHSFPWLFHWSVNVPGGDPRIAVVDRFGRLHALGSGVVDVSASPRFGHGFGTARFIITPPGVAVPQPPTPNPDVCWRAGGEIHCRLGSPLGDVQLSPIGNRAGQWRSIRVTRLSDSSIVQSIALPRGTQWPVPDADNVIRAFDADGDGHPDLVVLAGPSPDGGGLYRLWRFDTSAMRFFADTAFGLRPDVSSYAGAPCVETGHVSDGHFEFVALCIRNGRWTPLRQDSR